VSQHGFGMEPCPWCVLQRLVFVAIGVFALLGLVWRGSAGTRSPAPSRLLLGRRGLAAALWQHFVAAQSASCNLTLADRIVNATGLNALPPGVFEARANCADAGGVAARRALRLLVGRAVRRVIALMVVALRRA
jgi:disulfide bond formation protein DsbB